MRLRLVLLIALAIATVGVVVTALARDGKPPPFAAPQNYQFGKAAPTSPVVLIVGDSYAAGTGATSPTASFAGQTAKAKGWTLNLDAQGDTGFLNDGRTASSDRRSYGARLPDTAAHDLADIVIVTGGRNDLTLPQQQAEDAARQYLRDVHRAYPRAKLVVVAPFWVNSNPPARLQSLAGVEREEAQRLGAVFIDPLAEGWINDRNAAQLIGPDGTHPTQAGHDQLANRLVAALQRNGL